MKNTDELYSLYLSRSQEVVSLVENPVVLKTDCFNEGNHKDRPFIKPIIGNIEAKEIWCVEVDAKRIADAKPRINGSAKIIQGDLRTVELPTEKFDVILDLSTIDHIPTNDVTKVFKQYNNWLKLGGRLLIFAWLTFKPSKSEQGWHPNVQYYFDAHLFPLWLWEAGFSIERREVVHGSKASPFIAEFQCRKVMK